jgi:hypothetical protein
MVPRNTARRIAAVASLTLVAACSDAASPTGAPDLARSPQAQARLEAVFQRVTPEVLSLPGTVFTDNDEQAGKVVIGVEHAGAARGVRTAMSRLGISEADYDVEVTAPIVQMATLRDVFRPMVAGIQLHYSNYLCTLGFNVDHSGGRSFITNSHCTRTQGGVEGTQYYQPTSTASNQVVATEVADPLYAKGGICPKGKKCRYSDASRALYSASVASNRGEIAQTTGFNNGSLTVSTTNPLFTITSQDNSTTSFPIGTVVNKVGRTTGWTRGQVTRTCVNTGVQGSQVVQLCQTFVSDAGGAAVVGSGDSGSGVFTVTSGNSVRLVGILWGGSSDNRTFIFSPLKSIQDELGSFTATK